MLITHHYIDFEKGKLHYIKTGRGASPILLFHGFGQTHLAYQSWYEPLHDTFTIYSFDLFFHGNSTWHGKRVLKKQDWKKIIACFIKKESITHFSIGGFSLGARFALVAMEQYPHLVKQIVLLAPDGIQNNFWYRLVTSTMGMRYLFKCIVFKSNRLPKIFDLLGSLPVIEKRLLNLAKSQTNTLEKRHRVYFSWIYFRLLQVDLKHIAFLINQHHIKLQLYVGKFDALILPQHMYRLLNLCKEYRFEIVKANHFNLINESLHVLYPKSN